MYRQFLFDIVLRKLCDFIVSRNGKNCKLRYDAKYLLCSAVIFAYFQLFEVEFQAFVHYAIFSANYYKIPKVICEFRRK